MWHLKEFVPEGLKHDLKLIAAKLRHPGCFIASPHIGRRVALGRGCSILAGAQIVDGVSIGDYSYVNFGTIFASGTAGKFCSIGPYAIIGMPEHPTSYLSTSPKLYGNFNLFEMPSAWHDYPISPQIGSDVWIGAGSFIRQNVRIGHGAVVGAGAVVTRDVPPYAIVAGTPARLIRFRFEPQVIDCLLRSAWWDRSPQELAAFGRLFQEPWKCDAPEMFHERAPEEQAGPLLAESRKL